MPEVWTVKKILDWTSGYFSERQIPEPRLSAELLLADILDCKRISLYVQFERILSKSERDQFRAFVKRRAENEPVQYILGETEFMGLPFRVRPGVLIPRPDSELLVDRALEFCRLSGASGLRIIDLGTGSGCLAISLAKLLPQATVTAIDNQTDALEIAAENAAINDVQVEFLLQDMQQLTSATQHYDIIISNPPYVRLSEWQQLHPQVRDFEPDNALVAGDDGLLFYRHITTVAGNLLSPQGRIFLEVGYDQAPTVQQMLTDAGFQTIVSRDFQQIERVVEAWKPGPLLKNDN